MKRKSFIAASVFAVATIPFMEFMWLSSKSQNPLINPEALNRFCSEQEIREIGIRYTKLFPDENVKEKLIDLLLTNIKINKIIPDRPTLIEMLDKKIYEDFNASKIIIINGWVISVTEARQCALFSLK